MRADGDRISAIKKPGLRNLIFPGCVLVIYAVVFVFAPARAAMAFGISIGILRNLMLVNSWGKLGFRTRQVK